MWTYVLTNLSGKMLAEVRNAGERKVTMALNRASTASFSVRADNPVVNSLYADDTLLKIYEDKTLRFYGPIVSAELATQGAGTVQVNAADPAWRLSRRISGQSKGGTAYTGNSAKVARKILAELMTFSEELYNPHHGIKLKAESEYTGGGEISYTAGPYASSLTCLNDVANTLSGFDWYMAPIEGETANVTNKSGSWTTPLIAEFEAETTYGGEAGAVFEYGYGQKNVRNMTYTRDLSILGNKAIHLPDDGLETGSVKEKIDIESVEHRGRFEAIADASGLNDSTLREKWLDAFIRVRKNPRFVVSMALDIDDGSGRVPQIGADFWLGDIVQARSVIDGTTLFNGKVRVYQIQVDINQAGTATVTPVLVDEEGGEL